MKILLVGSGGREHALAWKLAQSPQVQTVYVAPGNGGTATAKQVAAGIQNLPISGLQELADFAKREKIHLTVVGPEAPLAAGIVDVFRKSDAVPGIVDEAIAVKAACAREFMQMRLPAHRSVLTNASWLIGCSKSRR